MFGNNREQMRQLFFDAWQKHQKKQPLSQLEEQILAIVLQHPEYHPTLNNPKQSKQKDYHAELNETNPFLHLSLHLALHEQLSTQRPAGINGIYQSLSLKLGDPHQAEHKMMEVLAEVMWEAQATQQMPNEDTYLARLKQCLKS